MAIEKDNWFTNPEAPFNPDAFDYYTIGRAEGFDPAASKHASKIWARLHTIATDPIERDAYVQRTYALADAENNAWQLAHNNARLEREQCIDLTFHTPNRYGMERWFNRYMKLDDICVVVDLEDFKVINDRFGHVSGDIVLRETVVRLHALLHQSLAAEEYATYDLARIADFLEDKTGVVFRSSGDEFGILMAFEHLAPAYKSLRADELHAAVIQLVESASIAIGQKASGDCEVLQAGHTYQSTAQVTMRAGFARYEGEDLHEMLKRADYDLTTRRANKDRERNGRLITWLSHVAMGSSWFGEALRDVTEHMLYTVRAINPALKRRR